MKEEKHIGKKQNTSRKAHFLRRAEERGAYGAETPNEGLVSGRNAVKELLAGERDIDKIFVARGDREGSIVAIVGEAVARKIPVVEVDRKRLDSMCGHNRHQGVVAAASEHAYVDVDDILAYAEERGEAPLLLIADEIEDPHNLGALIRSAECAGVHGLIIPKRRAVGLTSVVAKASAGAIEHLRVAKVTNLAGTIDDLKKKGLWIYAADMDGAPYDQTDFRGAVAFVLGSEGFGISRLVKQKCDFVVSIPLHGKVNSLNVSAAGAVLLFEAARQRSQKIGK